MPESMVRDDVDEHYEGGAIVSSQNVRRFARTRWEFSQIKALFTPQEWSTARTVAPDVYEALLGAISPIDTETVISHIRSLIGPVLTAGRFTEITGQAE